MFHAQSTSPIPIQSAPASQPTAGASHPSLQHPYPPPPTSSPSLSSKAPSVQTESSLDPGDYPTPIHESTLPPLQYHRSHPMDGMQESREGMPAARTYSHGAIRRGTLSPPVALKKIWHRSPADSWLTIPHSHPAQHRWTLHHRRQPTPKPPATTKWPTQPWRHPENLRHRLRSGPGQATRNSLVLAPWLHIPRLRPRPPRPVSRLHHPRAQQSEPE